MAAPPGEEEFEAPPGLEEEVPQDQHHAAKEASNPPDDGWDLEEVPSSIVHIRSSAGDYGYDRPPRGPYRGPSRPYDHGPYPPPPGMPGAYDYYSSYYYGSGYPANVPPEYGDYGRYAEGAPPYYAAASAGGYPAADVPPTAVVAAAAADTHTADAASVRPQLGKPEDSIPPPPPPPPLSSEPVGDKHTPAGVSTEAAASGSQDKDKDHEAAPVRQRSEPQQSSKAQQQQASAGQALSEFQSRMMEMVAKKKEEADKKSATAPAASAPAVVTAPKTKAVALPTLRGARLAMAAPKAQDANGKATQDMVSSQQHGTTPAVVSAASKRASDASKGGSTGKQEALSLQEEIARAKAQAAMALKVGRSGSPEPTQPSKPRSRSRSPTRAKASRSRSRSRSRTPERGRAKDTSRGGYGAGRGWRSLSRSRSPGQALRSRSRSWSRSRSPSRSRSRPRSPRGWYDRARRMDRAGYQGGYRGGEGWGRDRYYEAEDDHYKPPEDSASDADAEQREIARHHSSQKHGRHRSVSRSRSRSSSRGGSYSRDSSPDRSHKHRKHKKKHKKKHHRKTKDVPVNGHDDAPIRQESMGGGAGGAADAVPAPALISTAVEPAGQAAAAAERVKTQRVLLQEEQRKWEDALADLDDLDAIDMGALLGGAPKPAAPNKPTAADKPAASAPAPEQATLATAPVKRPGSYEPQQQPATVRDGATAVSSKPNKAQAPAPPAVPLPSPAPLPSPPPPPTATAPLPLPPPPPPQGAAVAAAAGGLISAASKDAGEGQSRTVAAEQGKMQLSKQQAMSEAANAGPVVRGRQIGGQGNARSAARKARPGEGSSIRIQPASLPQPPVKEHDQQTASVTAAGNPVQPLSTDAGHVAATHAGNVAATHAGHVAATHAGNVAAMAEQQPGSNGGGRAAVKEGQDRPGHAGQDRDRDMQPRSSSSSEEEGAHRHHKASKHKKNKKAKKAKKTKKQKRSRRYSESGHSSSEEEGAYVSDGPSYKHREDGYGHDHGRDYRPPLPPPARSPPRRASYFEHDDRAGPGWGPPGQGMKRDRGEPYWGGGDRRPTGIQPSRSPYRGRSRSRSVSTGRSRSRSRSRPTKRSRRSRSRSYSRSRSRSYTPSSRSRSASPHGRSYSRGRRSMSRSRSRSHSRSRSRSHSPTHMRARSRSLGRPMDARPKQVPLDDKARAEEAARLASLAASFSNPLTRAMGAGGVPGMGPMPNMPQMATAAAAAASATSSQASRHARRIYVGGLPPNTTEPMLSTFLDHAMRVTGAASQPGSPLVNMYLNLDKRYAFVEFRSVEEASNALALDGAVFQGEFLKFRRPNDYDPVAAKALGPSEPSPHINIKALNAVATQVEDGPNKLFVGGLPNYLSEDHVRELLAAFGTLRAFNLVTDKATGTSKGFAFCEYLDSATTEAAIQGLSSITVGGRTLNARRSNSALAASAQRGAADQQGSSAAALTAHQQAMVRQAQMSLAASMGLAPPPDPFTSTLTPPPTATTPPPQHTPQETAQQTPTSGKAAAGNEADQVAGAGRSLAGGPALPPDATVVVRLEGMVTRDELLDDEDYEGLLEDTREEVVKYGTLLDVMVPRPHPTDPSQDPPGVGLVFLKYEDLRSAERARLALNGRKFGDDTVKASFFDADDFAALKLK